MSQGRARLLAVHRELLERFRVSQNLVGPGPIGAHYVDAERGLARLEPEGRWADLGTGAGFPGVVLAALHPGLAVDLVDSRRKRCMFLEEVLGQANCDGGVRVVEARIEELEAASYDGVTARAVAEPPELARLAARVLKWGGRLVLFLQADQRVTLPEGYVVEAEVPYKVEGRPLRVLRARWEPEARSA